MRLLRHITALFAGVLLAGSVMAAEASSGYKQYHEDPGMFAMVGDLLIARPIGAAITTVGAAAFVVSLPLPWRPEIPVKPARNWWCVPGRKPSSVVLVAARAATVASSGMNVVKRH